MHFLPERHWDINTPLLDLRKNSNFLDCSRRLASHRKHPLKKERHRQAWCYWIKIGFRKLLLGFCKLAARYYIHTCRLKGNTPRMPFFLNQIKCYASIEREVLSTKDFQEKWKHFSLSNPSETRKTFWSKINPNSHLVENNIANTI